MWALHLSNMWKKPLEVTGTSVEHIGSTKSESPWNDPPAVSMPIRSVYQNYSEEPPITCLRGTHLNVGYFYVIINEWTPENVLNALVVSVMEFYEVLSCSCWAIAGHCPTWTTGWAIEACPSVSSAPNGYRYYLIIEVWYNISKTCFLCHLYIFIGLLYSQIQHDTRNYKWSDCSSEKCWYEQQARDETVRSSQ